ncbi:class I SAM-dependent methyltransferase [Pseudonocardia abyssalis]|uniref:Methyltransferase domain-containing protein n=1 Tax=Pseudonocardia abyssalis TaxID=2792008 RepID=A0ABS6UU69_9PSEU|nr:methyltransferase domain-containing protein [Pseudonocardia abyssalis]MBW0117518.1 methyltransferase domain-containing protein [Pseudonocardia abyssalis]MBW0135799.1 methyltransferase domain-containing protein [Pseudonocardia abyssalis]
MTTLGSTLPLDRLRDELRGARPLPALTGERYALTHAEYEAASDQRRLLQDWMATALPPLLDGCDPVRVVGVGVGDGSIDAPLAAALATDGRRVHYTGVEPHAPSAMGFVGRLVALPAAALTPSVVVGDFAEHDAGTPADLVHFVHSLYYVDDLGTALDHALTMLRPGGLLVAATAPLAPLCVLTELLCPWGEHRPWFAGDVLGELDLRALDVRTETLVGHLGVADVLTDPCGRGEAVFDFLVGARTASMTAAVRGAVLDYLGGIVEDGHVPHPLDIMIARVR